MDRKKDGKGNLSVDTRRVTTENAPSPDICETRKDPSGLLACASVMPSFQTEALLLAELRLKGGPATARYLRLYRAFEASFLHYSRLTPDHWRHPRGTWTGFPDLPSVGSCVALAILAHGIDPDEMVIRYHEFLGAMASRFSAEEAAFALTAAEAAGKKYPDDPRFGPMIGFLRKKAVFPRTEEFHRAREIARSVISSAQA